MENSNSFFHSLDSYHIIINSFVIFRPHDGSPPVVSISQTLSGSQAQLTQQVKNMPQKNSTTSCHILAVFGIFLELQNKFNLG